MDLPDATMEATGTASNAISQAISLVTVPTPTLDHLADLWSATSAMKRVTWPVTVPTLTAKTRADPEEVQTPTKGNVARLTMVAIQQPM